MNITLLSSKKDLYCNGTQMLTDSQIALIRSFWSGNPNVIGAADAEKDSNLCVVLLPQFI
jgi:hypothetical protein